MVDLLVIRVLFLCRSKFWPCRELVPKALKDKQKGSLGISNSSSAYKCSLDEPMDCCNIDRYLI